MQVGISLQLAPAAAELANTNKEVKRNYSPTAKAFFNCSELHTLCLFVLMFSYYHLMKTIATRTTSHMGYQTLSITLILNMHLSVYSASITPKRRNSPHHTVLMNYRKSSLWGMIEMDDDLYKHEQNLQMLNSKQKDICKIRLTKTGFKWH
jgi:hypothetical protein